MNITLRSTNTGLIAGVATGLSALVILALVGVFLWLRWRRRHRGESVVDWESVRASFGFRHGADGRDFTAPDPAILSPTSSRSAARSTRTVRTVQTATATMATPRPSISASVAGGSIGAMQQFAGAGVTSPGALRQETVSPRLMLSPSTPTGTRTFNSGMSEDQHAFLLDLDEDPFADPVTEARAKALRQRVSVSPTIRPAGAPAAVEGQPMDEDSASMFGLSLPPPLAPTRAQQDPFADPHERDDDLKSVKSDVAAAHIEEAFLHAPKPLLPQKNLVNRLSHASTDTAPRSPVAGSEVGFFYFSYVRYS